MSDIVVRDLGRRRLAGVWSEMKRFTDERTRSTPDEIWFVEHDPVFTLGLNADRSHLLAPADIEVVQIDRGGQVTYHGPGQLVAYVLLDLRRLGFDIRRLVTALEDAVIATVSPFGVVACGRRDAPGVYIDGRKFAALGLRVRRSCTYHGLAVNVSMDLEPFGRINPCGHADLEVTELAAHTSYASIADYRPALESALRGAVERLSVPTSASRTDRRKVLQWQ